MNQSKRESVKFVSKYPNYRITLEPGRKGDPQKGIKGESGLHVKFEDGIAQVSKKKVIKKLENHAKYNDDFRRADDAKGKESRVDENSNFERGVENEPEHDYIEVEHGTPGQNKNPEDEGMSKEQVESQIKKQAMEMAQDIAKPMAKEMAQEMIGDLKGEVQEMKQKTQKRQSDQVEEQESDQGTEKESAEPIEVGEKNEGGLEDKLNQVESEQSGSGVEEGERDVSFKDVLGVKKSTLERKNKTELQNYAAENYGVELDDSNLKDEMIDNLFQARL